MSSTILRLTLLAGTAAITLVAFTGSATSASERSLAPAAKIVFTPVCRGTTTSTSSTPTAQDACG